MSDHLSIIQQLQIGVESADSKPDRIGEFKPLTPQEVEDLILKWHLQNDWRKPLNNPNPLIFLSLPEAPRILATLREYMGLRDGLERYLARQGEVDDQSK